MLDEGLIDGPTTPTAALALHASPTWAVGPVTTRPGPMLASSDSFTIVIRGRGGHASFPHLAADPVPVACEVVTALQTFVARSVSIFEPGVITVGRIEAGTVNNVIPEMSRLAGTVRTLSRATRAHILKGLHRVAQGITDAHGMTASVEIENGFLVTVNDPAFAQFVLTLARRLLGVERAPELATHLMVSEDFSYVSSESLPVRRASDGHRRCDAHRCCARLPGRHRPSQRRR
jgi:amidohydrolase